MSSTYLHKLAYIAANSGIMGGVSPFAVGISPDRESSIPNGGYSFKRPYTVAVTSDTIVLNLNTKRVRKLTGGNRLKHCMSKSAY